MSWCAGTGAAAGAGAGAGAEAEAVVVAASHEISIDEMLPINNQYHYEAEDIKILLHINLKNEVGLKILEPVCLFDKDRLSSEILLNRAVNVAEHIIIFCSLADYQWLGLSLQFSADNTLIIYLINTSGVSLSPEITLKLNEQLARLAGDLRIQEVRGLFREEAVNSGPYLVEYFKSLCKMGLPLEAHDINLIRKQHQAVLYANAQLRVQSERMRISNTEIFNEFNLRQYNNSPNIVWKIFSPEVRSWDEYSINHGIELVNMLLDFEFQEVINAILNIDISLSSTQFFSQLIDCLLSDYRYVRKNENMFRLLTEDSVEGLNAEAVKNLILAKSNHTKQNQVHAFFRFYHEIFQSEPTINVVSAGTEFLMNLVESGFDCANLIRLFAPFAYCRNRKGLTALQMALRNDRIVAPILLAHAPLVDSDHLAECISLADHHVRAATSQEKQWSWTIFFANRLLGVDVHQILLEADEVRSLNQLQIYRKQLQWLERPETFHDTDKKYEAMNAAKYFAIKFTLLFRLLIEVEHGRVELPALSAAAGAGAAAPSMEEHRALIVKRLLVELNRELALARIVFYVINYLRYYKDFSEEDNDYFAELRTLLATSIIKNLTKLTIDNSLIIPLYWVVSGRAAFCCGADIINSGHTLYLQITAQEDAYYLYLHNYGDECPELHSQHEDKFYPQPLGKITRADLNSVGERVDQGLDIKKMLPECFAFKEKGMVTKKIYFESTESMRSLKAQPKQALGNCIAYGHWRAQAAVTEGFGEAWSLWLVQQQVLLLNDLEAHIAAASSKDILDSTRARLPTKNQFNPSHAENILRPFAFPNIAAPVSAATVAAPGVALTFGGSVNNGAGRENNFSIN